MNPVVTQYAATVFLSGCLLVCIGAFALGMAAHCVRLAAKRLRLADLGRRLLEVCAGDWETAEGAIDSAAVSNKVFEDAICNTFAAARGQSEYARARAEFNAACQDTH